MKKSDYAREMDAILNNYLDYLEFGFKQPHESPDFSNFDIQPEEPAQPAGQTPLQQKSSPAPTAQQTRQIERKAPVKTGNASAKRALVDLAASVLGCTKCSLHNRAAQKVPGAGNPQARLFIITYPVTRDEELGGIPFARNFREDLEKWLAAIDIRLDEVFISNILKCCPHKAPLTKDHFEACRTYLDSQIELVNPDVIVTLGQVTFSSFMRQFINLSEQHGRTIKHGPSQILIPTFHPFDVRKSPELKRAVWEDLKKIKQQIGS